MSEEQVPDDIEVLEPLTEEEAYLWAILSDESGLDLAEFMIENPEEEHGRFRAWSFQWDWWRCKDPLQVSQCARAVGKSASIRFRAFVFPMINPGQEMALTAPELVHLEPITSLIEETFYEYRLGQEMLVSGRSGVTHRPFQMNFRNSARILGRIPQRDGRGVKGCSVEGTLVLTESGYRPVETLREGDLVLTHEGRWRPVLQVLEDVNDCYEVKGQGSHPLTVSCDHRFYGAENKATPKQKRDFEDLAFHDVLFLEEHQVYWATPTKFGALPVPRLEFNGTAQVLNQDIEEFWWLVGMYLADGYLSEDKKNDKARRVCWTPNPKYTQEMVRCIEAVGGVATVLERDHSSSPAITLASAPLHRWLEEHFGRRCHTKTLPGFALGLPEDHRAALFAGYFETGTAIGARIWEASSASQPLIVGLQMLAQSLGFKVTCSQPYQPKVTEICGVALKKPPRTAYPIHVMPPEMGLAAPIDDHLVGKVKSVEPVGKRKVYNPIIDEDHSYVTNSIVSHNLHPLRLEMDESQDYPHEGWVELAETLKRGVEGASRRSHGVTRGVRDDFYKVSQPQSGWTVHTFTAMHRPNWSEEEREEKIKQYGSYDDPDYRRNVLGMHGDATSPMFDLTRLMYCVSEEQSEHTLDEYNLIKIRSEDLDEVDIRTLIDFPRSHLAYRDKECTFWIGMDVGITTDPTEILVFAEYREKPRDKETKFKLLTRIQLLRVSSPDQALVMREVREFYRPKGFGMDANGVGLPLFQSAQRMEEEDGLTGFEKSIVDLNFSRKLLVGFDENLDLEEDFNGDWAKYEKEAGIFRNSKEWGFDVLRTLVDAKRLELPWDPELLSQMQGSTWRPAKAGEMTAYGKKVFSKGMDHCLDALNFFALTWSQDRISAEREERHRDDPVFASFV